MRYSGIGGQAVMEGVMMKNQEKYAVAVRKPDGEIALEVSEYKGIIKNKKIRNMPVLRGVFSFIESLYLGVATLTFSASFFEEEETDQKEKTKKQREKKVLTEEQQKRQDSLMMGGTVAFSIVLAVAIFMILPYYISVFFQKFTDSYMLIAVLEGLIRLAAKNFLNKKPEDITMDLQDSLQGNMREIIGTLSLKEINTDRDSFSDQVMLKASKDMDKLGIEILSCNIQNVTDDNGLIRDLGADNTSKIKKDAAIAKAQADRDIAIAQAEANKSANDARVLAETEIAEKNNELEIRKSELQKHSDTKKAEADAAYEIQKQEQEKTIQTATVNAQIAKAEREAELRKQEVAVQQQQLDAEVNKKADAERYKVEQEAAAMLAKRQREAEARKYELEKEAEAMRTKADAARYQAEQEAAGIRARGEAEAAAIQAKSVAEA